MVLFWVQLEGFWATATFFKCHLRRHRGSSSLEYGKLPDQSHTISPFWSWAVFPRFHSCGSTMESFIPKYGYFPSGRDIHLSIPLIWISMLSCPCRHIPRFQLWFSISIVIWLGIKFEWRHRMTCHATLPAIFHLLISISSRYMTSFRKSRLRVLARNCRSKKGTAMTGSNPRPLSMIKAMIDALTNSATTAGCSYVSLQ